IDARRTSAVRVVVVADAAGHCARRESEAGVQGRRVERGAIVGESVLEDRSGLIERGRGQRVVVEPDAKERLIGDVPPVWTRSVRYAGAGAEHRLRVDLVRDRKPRADRIRIHAGERAVAASRAIAFEFDRTGTSAGRGVRNVRTEHAIAVIDLVTDALEIPA